MISLVIFGYIFYFEDKIIYNNIYNSKHTFIYFFALTFVHTTGKKKVCSCKKANLRCIASCQCNNCGNQPQRTDEDVADDEEVASDHSDHEEDVDELDDDDIDQY